MTGGTEKLHHDEPVPSKQASRLFNRLDFSPTFDAKRRDRPLQWRKRVLIDKRPRRRRNNRQILVIGAAYYIFFNAKTAKVSKGRKGRLRNK
jgi:hypothetical protein